MKVPGKVRGTSGRYSDGLEHLEIWVDKRDADPLPYQDSQRVDVDLLIGRRHFRAGLRATPRNRYVWISPDLDDGTPKLAHALAAAGFSKNQSIILDVEGTNIQLLPT